MDPNLDRKVVIFDCGKSEYPKPPFNPPGNYPEYPFKNHQDSDKNNFVYDAIRNIFYRLGMNRMNFGDEKWNPLGVIIKPGNNVLIKPNLIRHFHGSGLGIESVLTNGAVIRAVTDYCMIALKGCGTITIGDAPIQQGDFGKILGLLGIDKLTDFYNKNSPIRINVVDFRREKAIKDKTGIVIDRIRLEGDPLGYTAIDLGKDSELTEISSDYEKYRVTQYDKREMIHHHNERVNEYLIPNTVLNADVIINLPKLKSHRKAGMTCALKNMVGISGSKDWLPHHRIASLQEGGDEYRNQSARKKIITNLIEMIDVLKNKYEKKILKYLISLIYATNFVYPFKDPYFEGSWWGNDTIPRTIIDLNKIIVYSDKNGILNSEKQRKHLILVDAIIAGEGEGPLEPMPKECGLLIAGFNPVAVDLVCSRLIGFDYKKIPTITRALNVKKYRLFNFQPDELEIISNNKGVKKYRFEPTRGWNGHIELED